MPKHPYFLPDLRDVLITDRGHLVHWDKPGGLYSITYRLADSLPAAFVERLHAERDTLRRRAQTAIDRIAVSRVFEGRVDSELDRGLGACHLADPRIAEIVVDNLRHFNGQNYDLIAWCVMPNHVHAVVQARERLAKIVHSWKSYTGKQANRILARDGVFWMREYFDRIIRDEEDLARTVDYVLANPQAAGLRDWKWVGRA